MKSLRIFNRQAGRVLTTIGLLVATVAPAFTPALVAADTVTDRSIELSNSSKAGTNVTYRLKFTTVSALGAFVVQFCSNSPLLGSSCTAPSGFDADSAATSSGGYTIVGADTNANKITTTATIGAASAVDVTYTGITNPTNAGTLYARIVTYTNGTHAAGYTDTDPDATSAHLDDGGVAMSITNTVGVSAAVLESLTFCVSGQTNPSTATNPVGAGCTSTTSPSLELGETVGAVKALSSSAVSTGDIYTQVSSNAVSGVIVSLKSNNACGGLKRFGASVCDIAPALTGGVVSGDSKIGVKAVADSAKDTALSATGTYQIVSGSGYDGSNYNLNWVSGNATGVASTYGDPILDTGTSQPSNKNFKLTFGASISPNTPAGSYSNDYSLIATGKF